jgi:hypothetical protein
VDERMIISFIEEEVQYTRLPINVHVLFSPGKARKIAKNRAESLEKSAKLPEKPSELQ